MKLPRRCATDEDAREALQECVQRQLPLHISLHPDYYYSSSSSSPTSGVKSKNSSHDKSISAPTQSSALPFPIPSYLQDMPNPDLSSSFTLVSFYRFRTVPDPELTVARMRELWKPFKVYGRVYVAEEGVNAQMAVPTNVLRHFEAASSQLEVLQQEGDSANSGGFKVNCDSHEMSVDEFYTNAPFRALHIRRRKQILVDGFHEPLDWRHGAGGDEELSPRDWHRRMPPPSSSSSLPQQNNASTSTPLILDCRNKYESDVGRFEGAIPLDTHTFKDSWAALEILLKDKDPETPIMTYCTGGIR